MIMRLRHPDRRGFRSPIRERRKREREYFYSAVMVLVVKIILLVFLIMLADVTFRVFHYRFEQLAPPVRYAVPALVVIFAIVNGFYIFKSVMKLLEMRREQAARRKPDAD